MDDNGVEKAGDHRVNEMPGRESLISKIISKWFRWEIDNCQMVYFLSFII